MKKEDFLKKDIIILFVVICIATLLRLYKITAPLSDFHSWRQADTAAVARNYARSGINLLKPHYDDFSSIQSGQDNPDGLRLVEFPLYNASIALFYKFLPIFAIEVWGRVIALICSLFIIAIIYYLLLKEYGRTAAFFSSLIYAVYPTFIFFSRVVLPETPALCMTFLSIFFLYQATRQKNKIRITLFTFSLIFFMMGVLIKPPVIFFGLTLAYLFFDTYSIAFIKKPLVYLYFTLSLLPFVWWRYYIQAFPYAIPASDWLITSVNTFEGQKEIFLKPAFFRWIFYERITVMILGGLSSFFFYLGIAVKQKKLLLHAILASSLCYLFVFEGGNVQHEYYQTLILPCIAMFCGVGIAYLLLKKDSFIHPVFVHMLIFFVLITSILFSYYYKVKDFYTYPADLNQMAKVIDLLTKQNDLIVTDRMGDTTLLYLADRKGSPAFHKPLQQFKEQNYKYFISDNKNVIENAKKEGFEVVFENNAFTLFALN